MRLQDELNPRVTKGYWIAQRIGWAAMTLVLVLAVTGFFGGGIVSRGTRTAATEGMEVTVDYPRWNRAKNLQRIQITVVAPEATGSLRITLSDDFADDVFVQSWAPEPDGTALSPQGVVYEWQVDDWSRPLEVTVGYTPDAWRVVGGAVTVRAGDERVQHIEFEQFLFP